MSDYTIKARIVVDDTHVDGIDGAKRQIRDIQTTATSAGIGISNAFSRMFMLIGGAAGIGMATRGILQLHTSIQDATSGMATLLSAQTGAPITQTLSMSRDLVQGLRQDAAVGVGELSNYMEGLQSILGPGLASGATMTQMRDLTRLSLAAGFALRGQEGLQYAPRDIAQSLTTGVSRTETPIVMQALSAVDMTAETFNRMDPGAKMATLLEAFGKFGPGVELMGKGWNAQMSTFQDKIKMIVTDLTAPLFDRWSEQLTTANTWLTANKDTIAVIVEEWGPRLVEMWDKLLDQVGTYATLVGGAAIGGKAAGMAAGSGLLGAAGGGISVAALGPLGLVAGAVAMAAFEVQQAFMKYPGLFDSVSSRVLSLWSSFKSLGETFSWFLPSMGTFAWWGRNLIIVFEGLTYVLETVVKVVDSIASAFKLLLQEIFIGFRTGELAQTMFGKTEKQPGAVAGWIKDHLKKVWSNWGGSGRGLTMDEKAQRKREDEAFDKGFDRFEKPVSKQNINIGQVVIHNDVKTNQDPRVIASSFDQLVNGLARYRMGAVRIPSLQGA